MSAVFILIGLAFAMAAVLISTLSRIAQALERLADAVEAQNKHYEIPPKIDRAKTQKGG